ATPPSSQPAGKLAVALAVLPWKKPPVAGMGRAPEQPSANGTSVGGTAFRTNAVSSTSSPSALSTTARYDPAGTFRFEARTGEGRSAWQRSADAAVHAGVARPTAPVSPLAMRSTRSTS